MWSKDEVYIDFNPDTNNSCYFLKIENKVTFYKSIVFTSFLIYHFNRPSNFSYSISEKLHFGLYCYPINLKPKQWTENY